MGQWEFIHKAPLNQLEFELNHSNVPNLVLLARVVVTLAKWLYCIYSYSTIFWCLSYVGSGSLMILVP